LDGSPLPNEFFVSLIKSIKKNSRDGQKKKKPADLALLGLFVTMNN